MTAGTLPASTAAVWQRPPALRAGDRIAIVSPASPFLREEFDAGVTELTRLGFEPVVDERVFARDGYVSGAAAVRAAHLVDAWCDPSIRAIVCARGGYGSVHLLPHLEADVFRASPKIFVGYSDVTTLLTWLTLTIGVVTFHGPMVAGRFSQGPARYDASTFLAALTSSAPVGRLEPASLQVVRGGEASGVLIGGTLTQIVASLGTGFAFDPPPGHMLFLDEVNERPYRIDRMLTQLRLSGLLDRAAGIVFNELPNCDEPNGGVRALEAIEHVLSDFAGPVLAGFPSGHAPGATMTLPFGVRATIVARGRPALVIDEAAVV